MLYPDIHISLNTTCAYIYILITIVVSYVYFKLFLRMNLLVSSVRPINARKLEQRKNRKSIEKNVSSKFFANKTDYFFYHKNNTHTPGF